MKAKPSVSAAMITLAAVIIGFFMPGVVCGIQDTRREAQVINHEAGRVQLVLASDASLADKLLLIKNGHSRVDMDTGKTLDKSGAQKAAVAALTWLKENGFYPEVAYDAADFSCVPFLISSEDNAKSAIFWQCELLDDYGNKVKLIIDDENGKMVSCFYGQVLDAKTVTTYKYEAGGTDGFANMCLVYYGFSKFDIPNVNSNGYSDEYTFLYTDENGRSYAIPFVIAKNYYSFNA